MTVPADSIIRALDLILSNTSVYGASHAVTSQSAESCFALLQQVWTEGDCSVNASESGLTVNQEPVELKNMLAQHLADHLEKRDITNFSLKRGMTHEQFLEFIEVLGAKPQELQLLGGFAAAIAAVGLAEAVATRKVVYREITDEEEVVNRRRLEALSPAGSESGDAGGRDNAESVQAVMAFLRGDIEISEEGAARSVRDMGGDADQLAELIMHAAMVRASATSLEGAETLGDLVVGCLRRAYEAMTQDPSFHTQKTKKQVQRTLVLLERELLEKLQAMGDAAGTASSEAVKDTVEGLSDELTLDALAQEYARKRSAVGATEKRLMRYIKRKGADGVDDSELRQRLSEGGLDEAGWHELRVKSGVLPPASSDAVTGPRVRGSEGDGHGLGLPGGEGGLGALGTLATLLEKIGADVRDHAEGAGGTAEPSPSPDVAGVRTVALHVPEEVFKQDLHALQSEVDQIIHRTEKRIEKLVEEVGGNRADSDDEAGTDAGRPRLTRKRLFEILAEIGQELCQPLAVINCSVDMIRDGTLGEITDMQTDMLNAAADSGEKLKLLIDKLIAIAGVPEGFTVDKQIQASLYQ